jgi:hypothetical protein
MDLEANIDPATNRRVDGKKAFLRFITWLFAASTCYYFLSFVVKTFFIILALALRHSSSSPTAFFDLIDKLLIDFTVSAIMLCLSITLFYLFNNLYEKC